MALAKHLPTTFLLVSLFISLNVDARESQFFSKVTNTNDNNNNVVNVQETRLTNNKQETKVENNLNKQGTQENQPAFIPNENGYGLYDHGTGQLPPEATATTAPTTITISHESLYSNPNSNFNNNNMNKYNERYNYNNYYDNNNNNNYEEQYNNNYYNKDSYVTEAEKEQLGGAQLQQTDNYATMNGQNKYYTGGNRYSSNVKREGMSDTRFMENGRYRYDINNEEKYLPRYNQATRVDTTYQYQNEGNFGNRMNNVNEYNNYANNMNHSYNNNNNQEEFQETGEEFMP